MARHVILFIKDHIIEHPATVLESTLCRTGETFHVADIPARTTYYKLGQKVVFKNKKDALAFVKAMNGAAIAHIE